MRERRNPDARTRHLERLWLESDDAEVRDQLFAALRRSGELEGSPYWLEHLRERWADLAMRKSDLRHSVYACQRAMPRPYRRSYSGKHSDSLAQVKHESDLIRMDLIRALGLHGKLWATVVFGDYQTSHVRVHDEKDPPRGQGYSDWVLLDISSRQGKRLDLKGMKGGGLRRELERLRAVYGARSRVLELREAQEELPADSREWSGAPAWASWARGRIREGKAAGLVGWNPGGDV